MGIELYETNNQNDFIPTFFAEHFSLGNWVGKEKKMDKKKKVPRWPKTTTAISFMPLFSLKILRKVSFFFEKLFQDFRYFL
jgi:hypothetical protein